MGKTRNWQVMALLFAAVWLLRIATLPFYPIPAPVIHDEFANMLAAKTFALGRLTNPPLLYPDSMMELQSLGEPTRTSKYPPAMSAFMAAGIALFGDAYWGVVLCMALAVTAAYWCLCGWVGRRTALVAAALLLLMLRAPHYWMYSYWGGGPAMLAGFLLTGAYARVFIHHRYRYAAVGCAAIVLALLSRPFEGMLITVSFAICGLWQFIRHWNTAQRLRFLSQAALPAALIFGSFITFQLYYNHTITGQWLTMPYMLHTKQNAVCPLFVFQKLDPGNISSHYVLRYLQEWELHTYTHQNLPSSAALHLMAWSLLLDADRLSGAVATSAGLLLLLFFTIAVPAVAARRDLHAKQAKYYALYFSLLFQWLGSLLSNASNPHYFAPLLAVYLAVWCRWAEQQFRQPHYKPLLHTAIAGLFLFYAAVDARIYANTANAGLFRKEVIATVQAAGGKHLIFVDLRSPENIRQAQDGWVYNEPDIDSAQIVLAWYFSPEENQKIIAHYPGRKIWYVVPGNELLVRPYDKQ